MHTVCTAYYAAYVAVAKVTLAVGPGFSGCVRLTVCQLHEKQLTIHFPVADKQYFDLLAFLVLSNCILLPPGGSKDIYSRCNYLIDCIRDKTFLIFYHQRAVNITENFDSAYFKCRASSKTPVYKLKNMFHQVENIFRLRTQ